MNSKKKVLIVSRSFYPQNSPRSFRTTELAKELARQGHNVDVLLPANLRKDIENDFDNELGINFLYFGPLIWKNLGKTKNPLIGDLKRKFGRLLFLLFEYPNIEIYFKLQGALKKLNGYDLLISIAVPHENHWAIAKVRSNKHPIAKTWVADCGDPFMTNVLETISPPFYFGWLEKSFLKKADYVSVPTLGSINGYNSGFRHKFKVIPQGFDFNEVELIDFKPKYEIPTFAYAGGVSVIGIRSLHQFIRVLKNSGKKFIFHVYSTNGKSILKDVVQGFEEKIILHDPLPRKALLFELSKMDFLVNLDNGTHLNTPSKLIDYGLTKRPILNIDPLNPEIDLIYSFLDSNYSRSLVVSDLKKNDIKEVAKSFLSVCL